MAELKTKKTEDSVTGFLAGIEDAQKRQDCERIAAVMLEVTGEEPRMWGASIVGFGRYHYRYESGREGDWFVTGFSPRKQNISIYIMAGFQRYDDLMAQLRKYKTGKSCLYIKRLEDVDLEILRQLIRESAQYIAETHA